MRTRHRTPLLTLVLAALVAPAGAQQPTVAQVDPFFADYGGQLGPGCAVGVSQDGTVIFERAYGLAELEHGVRNTAATIFEAGSVSKQFTAAATILLALDGKLSLDDDIRTYIPELPDYGQPVTIRHLLNHTSGLRDWGAVAALEGWPRTTRVHTHDHMLEIAARQAHLNYPPGEQYSYTNTGYNLQAVLIERVSGMPFADFSRERIFRPLGLTSTSWRDDYTRLVPRRAQAYTPRQGGWALDMPFENVHGNGGLLTTVGDLLTWTEHLEQGTFGARFKEEMHRTGVLTSGEAITYASGLVVSAYRGVPEVSHSGSTAGYRAYLARYPEQRMGVAVLCNAANANATSLAHNTIELWLGSALAPVPVRTGNANVARPQPERWRPATAELAAFSGTYHSPEANATYRVVVEGQDLVLHPWTGAAYDLVPGDEPDTFQARGGTYRFIRATGGQVVELSVEVGRVFDMRFERVN